MATTGDKRNFEVDAGTRLTFDERLLRGTWGAAWPVRSRFESRGAICEPSSVVVDLIGRPASQGHMRPVLIVPIHKQGQFATKRVTDHRDDGEFAGATILHCFEESLDDRNAPRLTDHTLAMTNACALAPRLEFRARELCAAVGDEILRRGSNFGDDSIEKATDLLGCWLLFEDGIAEGASRVVVDDDCDPPTKWKTLRQCER